VRYLLKDENLLHPNIFKQILTTVFLAAIYFMLAKSGLILASISNSASPVWPATGFAFFIIYKFGFRVWPAIALGAFVANYFTPVPVQAALLIAVGNTLEALAGGYFLGYFNGFKKYFQFQDSTVATIVASLLGPNRSFSFNSIYARR
jgi:integral membrane sensor domain MASE1